MRDDEREVQLFFAGSSPKDIRHRTRATAWLRGHEFWIPSSVLEFWLMVYG